VKRKISETTFYDGFTEVTYKDLYGKCLIHNPLLGVAYDRTFLDENILDRTKHDDVSSEFALNSDWRVDLTNKNEWAEPLNRNSILVSSIAKQAELFISLALSLGESNFTQLVPTFSAIYSCIRAGWKPIGLPQVRDFANHLVVTNIVAGCLCLSCAGINHRSNQPSRASKH
jgi:hypothetical protein